jgi:hypothetical protein
MMIKASSIISTLVLVAGFMRLSTLNKTIPIITGRRVSESNILVLFNIFVLGFLQLVLLAVFATSCLERATLAVHGHGRAPNRGHGIDLIDDDRTLSKPFRLELQVSVMAPPNGIG